MLRLTVNPDCSQVGGLKFHFPETIILNTSRNIHVSEVHRILKCHEGKDMAYGGSFSDVAATQV
jgi:hypothetical protein